MDCSKITYLGVVKTAVANYLKLLILACFLWVSDSICGPVSFIIVKCLKMCVSLKVDVL